MSQPKVSVLIPVYNTEKFIDEAIKSVLRQTFTDFELIIVDNCSTDNSYAIINGYKVDQRVRIYQNESNIGMARNWNQCMLYARGEYIKFLCADDYFESFVLEEYVKVMDLHRDVSLVISPRQILNKDNEIIKWPPFFIGKKNGTDVYIDIVKNHINPLGEPTIVMFRRKDIHIGLFNEDLIWLPDIDYWLKLCLIGNVYGIEKCCTVFRHHVDQGTQEIKKNKTFIREEKRFIYYNFFIRNSILKENYTAYIKTSKQHLLNQIVGRNLSFNGSMRYLNEIPFHKSITFKIYIILKSLIIWIKRNYKRY